MKAKIQMLVLKVLLTYKGKGFCGGVIYKPTWILTASHCLENTDAQFLKVVAGMNPCTEFVLVCVPRYFWHDAFMVLSIISQ